MPNTTPVHTRRACVLIFTAALTIANRNGLPSATDNPKMSKKLSTLFAEAKNGSNRPIHFRKLAKEESSDYLGRSEFSDPKEVTIAINPSVPSAEREVFIAHELFHVILLNEGFPLAYHFDAALVRSPSGHMIQSAALQIANCYIDALIDKRMIERGFQPQPLIERLVEATTTINMFEIIEASKADPLWANYVALRLYCLSLRTPRPDEKKVDAVFFADRKIVAEKNRITSEVASDKCSRPEDCLRAAKHLRDVSGFKQIQLRNPVTHGLE